MARNYSLVARMGDPEKARGQAFAQQVREAKIAFMRQFYGIEDKYARNTWMDAYHPEFYDTIAIDQRIKKETEALGYSVTLCRARPLFTRTLRRRPAYRVRGWTASRTTIGTNS